MYSVIINSLSFFVFVFLSLAKIVFCLYENIFHLETFLLKNFAQYTLII